MGAGGRGEPPAPAATEGAASPQVAASPVPSVTVVPPDSFQNPVFRNDFPDPGVIEVDGTYYAYATNGSGRNVQLARSADLVQWELLPDAMPSLPSWAQLGGSYVWAPEVMQIGDSYVLYYTARDKAADRQCIGVAIAASPEGKFKDPNDAPLICQVAEGGSIDANPFRDDDGTLYLYWKNDGNCCSIATYLYVQELTPDGLSLVGEPTRLVRNDAAWEGNLVEAPTMWKQDDGYFLFFSANNYGGPDYAIGYATCDTPTGPCQDAPDNPFVASVMTQNPPVVGPGHQTIVLDDDGETWLVYHAWEVSSAGLKTTRRFMWIDPLVWEDGRPQTAAPSTAPQLRP